MKMVRWYEYSFLSRWWGRGKQIMRPKNGRLVFGVETITPSKFGDYIPF